MSLLKLKHLLIQPTKELKTSQLIDKIDSHNVKKLFKITKMLELKGLFIKLIFYRNADRDVVSETIGLVNKELRTLRE